MVFLFDFRGCLLQPQQTSNPYDPPQYCLLLPAELGHFRYRGCRTGAMSPPTMSYDGPGPGMERHFRPQPVGISPLSRNVPNHGSGIPQGYSRPALGCRNKKLQSGFCPVQALRSRVLSTSLGLSHRPRMPSSLTSTWSVGTLHVPLA